MHRHILPAVFFDSCDGNHAALHELFDLLF